LIFIETRYLQAQFSLPDDAKVTATSAAGEPGKKYGLHELADGNQNTWWASANNAPLPQSVEISWDEPCAINAVFISIRAGAQGTAYAPWKNYTIELSTGEITNISLSPEESQKPQIIVFPIVYRITGFKIVINEAWDMINFICINEVAVGMYVPPIDPVPNILFTPGFSLSKDDIFSFKSAIFDRNLNSAFYKEKHTGCVRLDFSFTKPEKGDTLRFFIRDSAEIHGDGWTRWKKVRLTINKMQVYEKEFINAFGPNEFSFPEMLITSCSLDFLEAWNIDNKGFALNEVELFLKEKYRPVIPEGIAFDYEPERPSLFFTKTALDKARILIEKQEWASEIKNGWIRSAEQNSKISDQEILAWMPKQRAIFIHGLGMNLCPICRKKMTGKDVLLNTRTVMCESGHKFPSSDFPDTGEGWKDPKTGSVYYFQGILNHVTIRELRAVLPQLCYAWLFTGEDRYAKRAALIIDAIALISPTTYDGPLDYPGLKYGEKGGGRLGEMYYQVPGAVKTYALCYDILCLWSGFKGKTLNPRYKSIEENIRHDLLLDSADYCMAYLDSGKYRFSNGALDFGKAGMYVGIVLGIKYYQNYLLTHGSHSFTAMLANTFDRDGCYYECSFNYERHTRTLWEEIASTFVNLRNTEYPKGFSFFQDPVFHKAFLQGGEKYSIVRREPAYGDSPPDFNVFKVPISYSEDDFRLALKFYSHDPKNKIHYKTLLEDYTGSDIVKAIKPDEWKLFNLPNFDNAAPLPADTIQNTPDSLHNDSTVFGRKGIAILRTGNTPHDSGIFFRYGATLNHGQLDEMAFILYSKGREFSFDPGHYNTHYRMGWTRTTLAHNTVVINKESQLSTIGSGGSLEYMFHTSGIKCVKASDTNSYLSEKISLYNRTLLLVDITPHDVYVIDIFDADGGEVRDYSFHAPGKNWSAFKNLDLSGIQRGKSLSDEGHVWGNMVEADWRIKGRTEGFYWLPPGDGYGFLMNPAEADAGRLWSARWEIDDRYRAGLEFTMLGEPGRRVYIADAPDLMGVKYAIARDTGSAASRYFTVHHPFENISLIKSVKEIPVMFKKHKSKRLADKGIELIVNASSSFSGSGIYQYMFSQISPRSAEVAEFKILGQYNSLLVMSRAKNENITFPFLLPEQGIYTITLTFMQSSSYGSWDTYLNGKKIGQTFTGASGVTKQVDITAGTSALSSGENLITFTLVSDSGYMGLVSLNLENTRKTEDKTAEIEIDRTDRILKSDGLNPVTFDAGSFQAEIFLYQVIKSNLTRAILVKGNSFTVPEFYLKTEKAQYQGTITSVNYEKGMLIINEKIPDCMKGKLLIINNPEYNQNGTYTIRKTERIKHADKDVTALYFQEPNFFLSQGQVSAFSDNSNGIRNSSYFMFATGLGNRENGYFNNKIIRNNRTGITAKILKLDSAQISDVTVDNNSGFEPGDIFQVCDLQQGDSYSIPLVAAVEILTNTRTEYTVHIEAGCGLEITVPFKTISARLKGNNGMSNIKFFYENKSSGTGQTTIRLNAEDIDENGKAVLILER